jgi:hypothetical protein
MLDKDGFIICQECHKYVEKVEYVKDELVRSLNNPKVWIETPTTFCEPPDLDTDESAQSITGFFCEDGHRVEHIISNRDKVYRKGYPTHYYVWYDNHPMDHRPCWGIKG